jgi:hypothetical protein
VLTVVERFQVSSCASGGDRIVWRIARDDAPSTLTEPLRITYGRVPPGYREGRAAEPLVPGGCYQAGALAAEQPLSPLAGFGGERFHVLPNGQLITGYSGGLIHSSRPFRQLNRAAVGCTRGYRRARTPADSAAVDARQYTVLDNRLSCQWLYANWPDLMTNPASTEHGVLAILALLGVFAGLGFLEQFLPDPPS